MTSLDYTYLHIRSTLSGDPEVHLYQFRGFAAYGLQPGDTFDAYVPAYEVRKDGQGKGEPAWSRGALVACLDPDTHRVFAIAELVEPGVWNPGAWRYDITLRILAVHYPGVVVEDLGIEVTQGTHKALKPHQVSRLQEWIFAEDEVEVVAPRAAVGQLELTEDENEDEYDEHGDEGEQDDEGEGVVALEPLARKIEAVEALVDEVEREADRVGMTVAELLISVVNAARLRGLWPETGEEG